MIVNRNPVPEINERRLKTKMRVADGETVVIGGLIVSTLLTLLIVPAGFSLADGLEKRVGPWMRRNLLTYRTDDDDAIDAHEAAAKDAKKKRPPASSTGGLQPAE